MNQPASAVAAPSIRMVPSFRPQCEFDWEFPHAYPILLVSEVAELLNCCERQVYDLADEGRFLTFVINCEENPQREHLRIVRATCHKELRAIVLEDWAKTLATIDAWLFAHTSQFVTVKEVSFALRCFPTHVRALYDKQILRGPFIGSGDAEREHIRIERKSVVEFVRRRINAKNGLTEGNKGNKGGKL